MKNDGKIIETKNNDTGVIEIVIDEKPKSLFRFRSCNEYNINSFIKDEIWLTRPSAFNDPYDFTFIADESEVIRRYDEFITSFIGNAELEKGLLELKTTKSIFMKKQAKDLINHLQQVFKRQSLVGCFTTRIRNEIMWAHYADSSKGYAIEYDYSDLEMESEITIDWLHDFENNGLKELFNQIGFEVQSWNININDLKKSYGIFPVRYRNGKYNGTEFVSSVLDNMSKFKVDSNEDIFTQLMNISKEIYDPNKSKIINHSIALHKKRLWQYEYEWRLIIPNLFLESIIQGKDHIKVFTCKPKAIYLGENISNINRRLLMDISEEKGIDVFQMESNLFKKRDLLTFYKL